jgi:4-hydroxy-tetrahydrodipicolinate reductase
MNTTQANATPITVAVLGATGKMGLPCVQTILNTPNCQLVGAVSRRQARQTIPNATDLLPHGYDASLNALLERLQGTGQALPHVVVDLTHPDCVFDNAMALANAGIRPVIGATGLSAQDVETLTNALNQQQLGGIWAPNFAIGALLMMQFATKAAQYFGHAELIELHHNQKADAPSGTALKTAHMMAEARQALPPLGATNAPETELLPGARGAVTEAGLHIHSIRLPGLVAHQQVLFGATGQLLTIQHDAFDREAYMPGII